MSEIHAAVFVITVAFTSLDTAAAISSASPDSFAFIKLHRSMHLQLNCCVHLLLPPTPGCLQRCCCYCLLLFQSVYCASTLKADNFCRVGRVFGSPGRSLSAVVGRQTI